MSWSISGAIWTFLGTLDASAAKVIFPAPNRPADGNVTLSAAGIIRIHLLAMPAAPRTATLKSTSPAPSNGQMQLVMFAEGAGPPGGAVSVRREDATVVITLSAQGDAVLVVFEGGVWRGVARWGTGVTVGAGW